MPYLHARVGYFSGVRIEKPFGMTFLCIMVVTFLKMPGHNLKRRANIFYETIFKCLQSSSLYARNTNFSSCLNWKSNSTIRKSLKRWSRKWYGLLYFDENFKIWRIEDLRKCWVSSFFPFNGFSILHILKSFHRNIANHTIFLISFSSSFWWYYCFFNFNNFTLTVNI